MRSFRLTASVAVVIVALGTAVAGGVVAATTSSDEQALQPTRQSADRSDRGEGEPLAGEDDARGEARADTAAAGLPGHRRGGSQWARLGPERHRSRSGSASFRRIAVEESRLHIPILFAFDTIHGFRTIFPIPLGTGASFDPQVASDRRARIGARESAAVGLKQTYAPMVDVSHEPRWGRIAEAAGEDPYLNSVIAAARVKGFQGSDYSARDKLVASPKHFAAYGQPEAGRDYNTTDMSDAAAAQPLPAAVQGGDRRRRRHGHVLVQRAQRRAGLRQPTT